MESEDTMNPCQRIVRLLAARGRETTPEQVEAWMWDYQGEKKR
jgi:hypothetical protein